METSKDTIGTGCEGRARTGSAGADRRGRWRRDRRRGAQLLTGARHRRARTGDRLHAPTVRPQAGDGKDDLLTISDIVRSGANRRTRRY